MRMPAGGFFFDGGWPGFDDRPWPEQAVALKAEATLARLDEEAAALDQAPFSIGSVAIACALGYMDFRFPDIDWRASYPNLARLYEKLAQRPSFIESRPS